MTVILMAGVSITAATVMTLVWFVDPVSDFNIIVCSYINYHIFFVLDEQFPPVQNVTVTDIGPTTFTVRWNVSVNSSGMGWFNTLSMILVSLITEIQLL